MASYLLITTVASGAAVVIASRSAQKLEQAKQQVQVETAVLDLTQEESVRTFFEKTVAVHLCDASLTLK